MTIYRVYLYLLFGVLVASSASIIIRLASEASFAVIAFYRLAISAVLLSAYQFTVGKRKNPRGNRQFHWAYVLAGLFLSGHFIFWIASLQMTTIANSIFLEGTHPLWAALVSALFLGEKPHIKTLPAFMLAVIGMFLIAASDFGHGNDRLLGDGLAIFSALMLALYLAIARRFRHGPDLVQYLIYVYGSAAVFCLVYIGVQGSTLVDFQPLTWLMFVLLALGPNLLGHSLLNWSSRYLEIYKVNFMLLLEPVLATIAAMLFLKEYPGSNFYLGALIILAGLGYLFYLEQRKTAENPAHKQDSGKTKIL
jgi:drug/metabolite transporter (DMT)-like permease